MTVFIFLILVVAPISAVVHELGHLTGAKLVKAEKRELHIGSGKPVGNWSLGELQITVYRIPLFGCYAYGTRKTPFTRWESVFIAICGPICNFIVAYVFFSFSQPYNPFIHIVILYNLWIGSINLIPFKFMEKHSDGYTIATNLIPFHKIMQRNHDNFSKK